MPARLMLGKP